MLGKRKIRPIPTPSIHPSKANIRKFIFLRDVAWLTISAFGGPQAHIAMMLRHLVEKRGYLTEEELIELQALCQILPGPTSTQTITAIAYKKGGTVLAFLTLLVWILPAATVMCIAALGFHYLKENNISIEFAQYIQPIAVGFVAFAAYKIGVKVIHTRTHIFLMVISAVISFFFRNPWLFPALILIGGFITAREYKRHHIRERGPVTIKWTNLVIFLVIFVLAISATAISDYRPILMFENFYRNGTFIFGGGQVLIPYIYSEFVEYKEYVSSEEFLTGFGLVQAMPGPVFSFSSFIGAMSSKDLGTQGMILGSLGATLGVFLPGTLLIFFVIKFWDELKKFRIVRASLDGINATSSGLVCAAALILFDPLKTDWINYPIIGATFGLLYFTRIPAPVLVLLGLGTGYLIHHLI